MRLVHQISSKGSDSPCVEARLIASLHETGRFINQNLVYFAISLFTLTILTCATICPAATYPSFWQVDFGRAPDQVHYYNNKIDPQIQEAAPLGPMAFRIEGNSLWLADSIGGRMMVFGANGKLSYAFPVPRSPENTLLEDFAFLRNKSGVPTSVWVADGADCTVKLLSFNGTLLSQIGGRGSEPGFFQQIHQLETDRFGRLYVGDYGKNTISIFNTQGKLEREIPWYCTGFALDRRGNLSTITFSQRIGHSWVVYSPSGQLIRSTHLGLPNCQNPRLWFQNNQNEILVSFVPPGGFRGLLNVYRFSAGGEKSGKFTIRPPQAMNRFFDTPDGRNFYIALADFNRAPKGKFLIRNLSSHGERIK